MSSWGPADRTHPQTTSDSMRTNPRVLRSILQCLGRRNATRQALCSTPLAGTTPLAYDVPWALLGPLFSRPSSETWSPTTTIEPCSTHCCCAGNRTPSFPGLVTFERCVGRGADTGMRVIYVWFVREGVVYMR